MNDKILVLINSIRRDVGAIAEIYTELDRHPLPEDADSDTLISQQLEQFLEFLQGLGQEE